MKFQNPSMHSSCDMTCIKKHDKQTEGRKDAQPESNNKIRPLNFEAGGIKSDVRLTSLDAILIEYCINKDERLYKFIFFNSIYCHSRFHVCCAMADWPAEKKNKIILAFCFQVMVAR